MWQEPIFDRTNADTLTARAGQSNINNHKGALNADDLNRIEDNYKYLMAKLRCDAIFIPHRLRNYTETVFERVVQENNILPDGYVQLEYIQSSGTQYIDTGFKPNQDTRVTMDFQLLNENGWRVLFGARKAVGTNQVHFGFWRNESGNFSGCYEAYTINFQAATKLFFK